MNVIENFQKEISEQYTVNSPQGSMNLTGPMTPSVHNGIQFESINSNSSLGDSFEDEGQDLFQWDESAAIELNSMGIILNGQSQRTASKKSKN